MTRDRLLDRAPQGTRLTEAGEVFLPGARALLRSAGQTAARTRAAAQPSRITIGYASGLIVTPAVRELRRRHPDADVQTLHLAWDEPRAALLDRRVDAVVTRLPFPTGELRVTVLYDEPRLLLIPLGHRLAGKESVTVDDIAGEPMPQPSHVVLATRADDRSRLVAAFRKYAHSHLTSHDETGD